MKNTQRILTWLLALMVAGLVQTVGAEEGGEAKAETADKKVETEQTSDEDEDWLNTVWTQVDEAVAKEETKDQNITTVAGVRGAEAEDNILDKLYYKGAKRYPSQNKLQQAVDTLKKSVAKDPKGKEAPKFKLYIAQCYEKLGQMAEAKDYYTQISKDHGKAPEAAKAQKRLKELTAPK
jgi:tetratricopeptide (TPR) repeat protein